MLATPLTSYRGLLYGLHYAALREKFDVKNIDCRSTIEPGIESITPAGKTIIDPDNRNTIPISNVVDVLKNYAQETKELQQKTDISIPYTNLTIANLRKKLRPHRGKTMYELFEGKKRKDMIYSSCFTPYKYPAAFMLAVGHKLIENRALVEMSRKDTTITDRYLAMGGGHIDNLENPLRAQGWRLIAESGVSSYQNDLEYYRRDSLHSAVDIAGHFRTLPPRGAPTPPAPGFFARLKNIFSYRQPRNTVKIQIQKHNK
jgi:hypothetical protein